jgi:CheY-like chemotaxis protein
MGEVLPNWSNQAVLLAEDNDDEILLFKRAFKLAELDLPLRIVRDGEEAIAYLKGEGKFSNRTEHPFPVLLLLDLKMPRKNGLQVLQWVRGQHSTKGLCVIILTNIEDVHAARVFYQFGVNSFITKSADLHEFARQLRRVKDCWLKLSLTPLPPCGAHARSGEFIDVLAPDPPGDG